MDTVSYLIHCFHLNDAVEVFIFIFCIILLRRSSFNIILTVKTVFGLCITEFVFLPDTAVEVNGLGKKRIKKLYNGILG